MPATQDKTADKAIPSTVEWSLRNQRRKDTRHYEQTELSIEGEARLLSLARRTGEVLQNEAGLDFDRIADMFSPDSKLDWGYIYHLADVVLERAPEIVTDATLVMFSIFPTEEDGTPNKNYEDERLFVRGAINLSKFSAILQVFAEQNDYRRLAGPFWTRLFALGERVLTQPTSAPQPNEPMIESASGPVSSANSPEQDTEASDTSSAA